MKIGGNDRYRGMAGQWNGKLIEVRLIAVVLPERVRRMECLVKQ